MLVFPPAVFANGQAFASGLQLLGTYLFFFARFQALGGRFMRHGHGAVAGDVFFGFFIAMFVSRY